MPLCACHSSLVTHHFLWFYSFVNRDFSDATLILIGHGSTTNEQSAAPVYQHAAELRCRKIFAQVLEAFWKIEPKIGDVLKQVSAPRIFVVPLFISEGYFTEEAIPHELGLVPGACFQNPMGGTGLRPVVSGVPPETVVGCAPTFVSTDKQQRAASDEIRRDAGFDGRDARATISKTRPRNASLFYAKPIGTHASMTNVILARAREVAEKFPFPRAPKPKDTALFIAGHGTEQNENSRKSIERQVELIRAQNLYAEVHPLFIEEEPRIAKCYEMAAAKNFVIVPFFISDGMHVDEDIPILLGEPERIVRQRLAEGKPAWRNPTERNGKLVWYSRAVGTEPHIADVILERVREVMSRTFPS